MPRNPGLPELPVHAKSVFKEEMIAEENVWMVGDFDSEYWRRMLC
jgi:hypothetical protein